MFCKYTIYVWYCIITFDLRVLYDLKTIYTVNFNVTFMLCTALTLNFKTLEFSIDILSMKI